jgi:hypothetical protein
VALETLSPQERWDFIFSSKFFKVFFRGATNKEGIIYHGGE